MDSRDVNMMIYSNSEWQSLPYLQIYVGSFIPVTWKQQDTCYLPLKRSAKETHSFVNNVEIVSLLALLDNRFARFLLDREHGVEHRVRLILLQNKNGLGEQSAYVDFNRSVTCDNITELATLFVS